ncbi:hypothetical protein F4804DRAFT_246386 [Jackrogersella minutella]|nr:hypothetical protein F4804DRAFT_246386 [Jackrogersella minutella]
MSPTYKGACLCGDVQLAISGQADAVFTCFCEHCNKGAGSTHQVLAQFPTGAVEIIAKTDSISSYTLTDTVSGASKEKVFCRKCGCPLWSVPEPARGVIIFIRTSILENGLDLKPVFEMFVKNRPSWVLPTDGASQWQEMIGG